MKKVIILALLVTGCQLSGCGLMKAFDVQYAERANCDGRVTPWANEIEIAVGRISYRINKTGWHHKRVGSSDSCEIEPADMERWNKCSGVQAKCKMYPKKKPKAAQSPKKGVLVSL